MPFLWISLKKQGFVVMTLEDHLAANPGITDSTLLGNRQVVWYEMLNCFWLLNSYICNTFKRFHNRLTVYVEV